MGIKKDRLSEGTFVPVRDPVLESFKDGARRIDLKPYYEPNPGKLPLLLSHVMLGSVLRDYVITKVKAPLMHAIIKSASRLPDVTKENTNSLITHTLIDIFDKFFEHEQNPGREEMFRAAFKIFLAEIEHDIYYRDRFNWFIEEILKAILSGKWTERSDGHPDHCWSEAKPYGGRHSLVHILQNKKLLENLLGDDWILNEE